MIKIAKIWSGVGQIVEVVESVSRMGEDLCSTPNSTNKQMDKRLANRQMAVCFVLLQMWVIPDNICGTVLLSGEHVPLLHFYPVLWAELILSWILQFYSELLWCLWLCDAYPWTNATREKRDQINMHETSSTQDIADRHGKGRAGKRMLIGLLFFPKINKSL